MAYQLMIFSFIFLFSACATMKQFHSMSLQEQEEYLAIAPKLTLEQRKTYLAKGDAKSRMEYLVGLDLHSEFAEKAAFKRMEQEKREDFLKAFKLSTPEERKTFLSRFDEKTRYQIEGQDLQVNWENAQVLLSIGQPLDILEKSDDGSKSKQLWIYDDPNIASYLLFEDGRLKNWAK